VESLGAEADAGEAGDRDASTKTDPPGSTEGRVANSREKPVKMFLQ
jgi:hypothetical protein